MFAKLFGQFRRPAGQIWRQGDVFLVPAAALPTDATGHRPVLAEGELTGHAHRLADPSKAQVFSTSEGLFLQVVADSATVVHEEHGPITVPRGTYSVRIQREYHPKEIRRVVD